MLALILHLDPADPNLHSSVEIVSSYCNSHIALMHLCVNTPIIYISFILKRVKNFGLRLCICAEVNLGPLLNLKPVFTKTQTTSSFKRQLWLVHTCDSNRRLLITIQRDMFRKLVWKSLRGVFNPGSLICPFINRWDRWWCNGVRDILLGHLGTLNPLFKCHGI